VVAGHVAVVRMQRESRFVSRGEISPVLFTARQVAGGMIRVRSILSYITKVSTTGDDGSSIKWAIELSHAAVSAAFGISASERGSIVSIRVIVAAETFFGGGFESLLDHGADGRVQRIRHSSRGHNSLLVDCLHLFRVEVIFGLDIIVFVDVGQTSTVVYGRPVSSITCRPCVKDRGLRRASHTLGFHAAHVHEDEHRHNQSGDYNTNVIDEQLVDFFQHACYIC